MRKVFWRIKLRKYGWYKGIICLNYKTIKLPRKIHACVETPRAIKTWEDFIGVLWYKLMKP